MSSAPACLCGSSTGSLVQSGVRHDPSAAVWRCGACDLVYTWPRPSASELNAYYADAYRREYGPAEAEASRQATAGDTSKRIERLAPLLTSTASVLDVGAGGGWFLEGIRDRVADVVAVEPDAPSRRHIEESIPAVASLEGLPEERRFDLVTVFHVLEHVPEPASFLRALAGRLRPDGAIAIEVPNIDDALVSVYPSGSYAPFYFQKAHLFYFSPATLARTAADTGLVGTVDFVQRYGLRNHLHWLAAGEPGGDRLYGDTVLDSADTAYRESLIRTGHADTLWLVARAG